MHLSKFFVEWFKKNGKDYPWRQPSASPFAFLITEMLVRQTRASSVAKVWKNFTEKYAHPRKLVEVDRRTLAAELKILGFGNQKAEALQHASDWLLKHHRGLVPNSLDELLRIPHIGLYSSRAILCFAYGQKIEIVDTNVQRFYARYFGLKIKADIRRNPLIWDIAKQNLPRNKKSIVAYNYGLLDFTADICKPGKPRCEICPLSKKCVWGRMQLFGDIQAE